MNAPVEKAERSWPLGLGQRDLLPNLYDLIVFIIIGAGFVALAHGAREMGAPRNNKQAIAVKKTERMDDLWLVPVTSG